MRSRAHSKTPRIDDFLLILRLIPGGYFHELERGSVTRETFSLRGASCSYLISRSVRFTRPGLRQALAQPPGRVAHSSCPSCAPAATATHEGMTPSQADSRRRRLSRSFRSQASREFFFLFLKKNFSYQERNLRGKAWEALFLNPWDLIFPYLRDFMFKGGGGS